MPTNPASRISDTMPEISHSPSWNPGRPTVRERMKPTNMPALIMVPRAQARASRPFRPSITATRPQPTAPSTNNTPMYGCSSKYSGDSARWISPTMDMNAIAIFRLLMGPEFPGGFERSAKRE